MNVTSRPRKSGGGDVPRRRRVGRQSGDFDPLFVSSLREAKWIVSAWAVTAIWVIGFCMTQGTEVETEPLATTLGMPSWAFWGVFVPWIAVTLFTIWFALTQIEDHPLEDARGIQDSGGVQDAVRVSDAAERGETDGEGSRDG